MRVAPLAAALVAALLLVADARAEGAAGGAEAGTDGGRFGAARPAPSAPSTLSAPAPPAPAPPPPPPKSSRSVGGWSAAPNTQYHVQTDEGPERYFKYQTVSGQYRKEKRLPDGTVVGSYGWVDADGFLRLREYVADDAGYRVLKTRKVFVGRDAPVGAAVAKAKYAPSQGGSSYVPPGDAAPPTTPAPYAPYSALSAPSNALFYDARPAAPANALPSGYSYNYDHAPFRAAAFPGYAAPPPEYDGVSATHNGFRYFLPRLYHEERTLPGRRAEGSFGYVDPFGIRRVVYYNTAPGQGFVQRKNNRYVGLGAPPYDPRF